MNYISNLLLRDDSNLAPVKNLEPHITGLKSAQTRELWHKALEEEHATQIKDKSLPVCFSKTRYFSYSRN